MAAAQAPAQDSAQDLETLPLPQLRALLRDAGHANAMLRIETEMFEKWYHKMEPQSLSLHLLSDTRDSSPEVMQTRGRYKSKSRGPTDHFVGLTVEQKCELVEWELEETKDEIQRLKEDSEQTLQDLEAVMEEADIWWADIKKAISDFEKDIISIISQKKGSIVASEKLLRYMEEKNHQRDLMKEKLRLKNDSLKSYKKKLQQQLRQRKLQNAMETSVCLMKDISQRKELLQKIEREAILVEEERAKAESLNKKLRRQLSDYRVPPVLRYVHEKMAVTDLKHSLKAWERKVAIAEMSLQSYRRAWNRVKMTSNQC
ncbi:coiled-coil domain-containing protein 113 isoform X4 [Dromaius novaehollandiae]|uniref:coiled-coil domain-containing protein 113 isoform X4 n=1 Tax=Dromaius novaehollandiae TaxID=8790 RepID=UPI00311D55A3